MKLISTLLSRRLRAQSAELLNLADAIDRFAWFQQMQLVFPGQSKIVEADEQIDVSPSQQDHYSDLLRDAPKDITAWRGARFRKGRNGS